MSGPEQRENPASPHFLAPAFANAMARATEPARQTIMNAFRARVAPVGCLRCRNVIALWAAATRCLYHVTADGGLGAPLSTDPADRVPVTCGPCDVTWQTSGRGVGRRLHKGLPPLA